MLTLEQYLKIRNGKKEPVINGNTCCFEYQAKTSLRPECLKGLNCPYLDKHECEKYKQLSSTELRYAHLNLRFK